MNALKKLFSLCLALMLVLSLAVPAMADSSTYTITINDANPGHIYEAYQIFAGTLLDGSKDDDDSTTGLILSDIKWGAGIGDNGNALTNALKNDETTITYTSGNTSVKTNLKSIFSSVTGTGDLAASQIAGILGTNQPVEVVDRFAEVVGHYSGTTHTYLTSVKGTSNYDSGTKVYTISGLPVGYYLVKDQEGSQNNNHDFYTKYMLQVVHSLTVQPKGSIPIVDKEINKTIGGTYTEANSFDINDDVFFKLTGTFPENLEAYTTYYCKFDDTLPAGMSFRELKQIEIVDHDGNVAHVIYDVTDTNTENNTLPASVTSSNVTEGTDGTKTWSLEFTNLKALYPNLAPDDKIVVKYAAYLNRKAAIDAPNANQVVMYYSNNPSGTGTGKTVVDYAHAFTHKFIVEKKETGSDKKLENVKFHLYYTRSHTAENGTEVTQNYYAQVITEEMVQKGELVNEIPVTDKDVGVVYGWTPEVTKASVLDTDSDGKFSIRGLDSGTYYLHETETNAGYNLLTNDVRITITADYVNMDTANADVNVTYAVGGSANGSLGTDGASTGHIIVENSKGNMLPTTGGVGTTLFYVIGGALVIGAVVMLITKKRMSSEY